MLSIKAEQASQLTERYREWDQMYWRPSMINREFASHFQHSAVRKMLISLTAWLHRRLLEKRHGRVDRVGAMSPAE